MGARGGRRARDDEVDQWRENGWVLLDSLVDPEQVVAATDDLAPWSCVIADVERAFGPVRHRDGSAPSRWTTDFIAPDEDGKPVAASAEFVWGLLQSVHRVEGKGTR